MVRRASFEDLLKRPAGDFGRGTIQQRVNLAALQRDKEQLAGIVLRLSNSLGRASERYRRLETHSLDGTAAMVRSFVGWSSAIKDGNRVLASAYYGKIEKLAGGSSPETRSMSAGRRTKAIASALGHAFIALRGVIHAQS